MITAVPPAIVPDDGEMLSTSGAGAVYVNLSAAPVADEPPDVVTVMSTVPVPAGEVVVICVPVLVDMAAVALPKLTAVAPVKPDP
jgi:hypothetical protein